MLLLLLSNGVDPFLCDTCTCLCRFRETVKVDSAAAHMAPLNVIVTKKNFLPAVCFQKQPRLTSSYVYFARKPIKSEMTHDAS